MGLNNQIERKKIKKLEIFTCFLQTPQTFDLLFQLNFNFVKKI